jgi:hypothetical protein
LRSRRSTVSCSGCTSASANPMPGGRMGRVAAQVEREADAAAAQGRTRRPELLPARRQLLLHRRAHARRARRSSRYRKSLRCSHEGLKRRYPTLEIVDVPYEGTALPRIS